MYKCRYFSIYELVPRHIYEKRGEKAWELLDERALMTLDALRDRFGKMTVNSWYWGGDREWSGLRTHGSPYFSETSQHSFGRAFDVIFADTTAAQVRQGIQSDVRGDFNMITSIELGVSWLHFDVRNCQRIKAFHP